MPGFGGQEFDPVALDKLRELRRRTDGRVLLEVDGGINDQTVTEATAAGADLLVIGTAFFEEPDYAQSLTKYKQLATSA
jgi:ribulose-phosphate 3-epimerase